MLDKVLILTYEMLPYAYTFGGCQRVYFLAEHLKENDVDVTVISCKKKFNNNFGKKINFKAVYFGDDECGVAKDEMVNKKYKDIARNIINKASSYYLNEPSNLQAIKALRWLYKYKSEILDYIKAEGYSSIIISGPPFCLFSFLPELKRNFPHIKTIIDFRDPWNLWNKKQYFAYYRERKILKMADEIVVVTEDAAKDKKIFFKVNRPIHTIYNGYSCKTWNKIKNNINIPTGKVKIAFFGSIDFLPGSYRDTSELFKSYKNYEDKIELTFIGVEDSTIVSEIKSKYPFIKMVKPVSQEESLSMMSEFDILLSMHTTNDQSGRYLIQGKIFDYIKSGKKILSIGSLDDCTSKLITSNKLGYSSNNNISDINKTFESIIFDYSNKIDNQLSNINDISIYSREYQNTKYLKLIKRSNYVDR